MSQFTTDTSTDKRKFDPEVLLYDILHKSDDRLLVSARSENVAGKRFKGSESSSTRSVGSTNIVPILCNVISALKNQIDYNGYYISFLLDQLSEEEFVEIAKSFAIEFKSDLSRADIEKVKAIKAYVGDILSNADISNITKIDESRVDDLLK